MHDPIELAWAAGFFDGEGTITIVDRRKERYRRLMIAIKQRVDEPGGPPEVLVRFQQAVGAGRIGGPYLQRRESERDRRQPFYMWYATEAIATTVLDVLWPQLCGTKRRQAERVLAAKRNAA